MNTIKENLSFSVTFVNPTPNKMSHKIELLMRYDLCVGQNILT